jgi:hypothetical protein
MFMVSNERLLVIPDEGGIRLSLGKTCMFVDVQIALSESL